MAISILPSVNPVEELVVTGDALVEKWTAAQVSSARTKLKLKATSVLSGDQLKNTVAPSSTIRVAGV